MKTASLFLMSILLAGNSVQAACPNYSGNYSRIAEEGVRFDLQIRQTECKRLEIVTRVADRFEMPSEMILDGQFRDAIAYSILSDGSIREEHWLGELQRLIGSLRLTPTNGLIYATFCTDGRNFFPCTFTYARQAD